MGCLRLLLTMNRLTGQTCKAAGLIPLRPQSSQTFSLSQPRSPATKPYPIPQCSLLAPYTAPHTHTLVLTPCREQAWLQAMHSSGYGLGPSLFLLSTFCRSLSLGCV